MTPFALKVHDVYIVINNGVELRAKAPPSIWLRYVSAIEIVADGRSCYPEEGELSNLKPVGKIQVSTTHLKPLLLVGGSYCWEVVGGRTVIPCPHAHSSSRLSIFAWEGKQRIPFSP